MVEKGTCQKSSSSAVHQGCGRFEVARKRSKLGGTRGRRGRKPSGAGGRGKATIHDGEGQEIGRALGGARGILGP